MSGEFLIIGLFLIFVIFCIVESIAEKRKKKKVESSEIEVYKYFYEIVLDDGISIVDKTTYSTLNFDHYSTRNIFGGNTFCVGDTVIATDHIIRINILETETVVINPIYSDSGFIDYDTYYSNKEVEERMVR